MSLAFVLIVMLIGGALTAAALWIVENATRTTRMAKQNALLYDATQEGIQKGLTALGEIVGGFTISSEDMSAVLETTDEGWEEALIVSHDMIQSVLPAFFSPPPSGGVFSLDFTPSGARELTGTSGNVKVYLQVFTLNYDVSTTGTSIDYVMGMPPKVKAHFLKGEGLEVEDDGQTTETWGEYPVWSFLIRSNAVSTTEKGNSVSRTSSFGVVMKKVVPPTP